MLIVFTLALALRVFFATGLVLGDDGYWLRVIDNYVHSGFAQVKLLGQAESRIAMYAPIGTTIKLFGWNNFGLLVYPILMGSILAPLTMLYCKPLLHNQSYALLAGLMICFHPSLVIDSGVIANDIPLITWSLCSVLFYRHTLCAKSAVSKTLASLCSGLALALCYTTKISGLPITAFWLIAETVLLRLIHPGIKPFWSIYTNKQMILNIFCFFLPIFFVQFFFKFHTGSWIGNYWGEFSVFDYPIPADYFLGKYDTSNDLRRYFDLLFYPAPEFFIWFMQSALYAYILSLSIILIPFLDYQHRKQIKINLSATNFIAYCVAITTTLAIYAFINYWPDRIYPYYLPNLFTGRLWRYLDCLAPLGVISLVTFIDFSARISQLTSNIFYLAVLISIGVSGYSAANLGFNFHDRASDLTKAGEYLARHQKQCPAQEIYTDADALAMLRFSYGWERIAKINFFTPDADYWDKSHGCIVVSGSRRDAIPASNVPAIENVKFYSHKRERCEFSLLYSRQALLTPWREKPIQVWSFQCGNQE
ncbi:phospholipid carrier-dependent glycosyltransferase [bacterium]|nr:phospholipid carrier-dependent glycosyltransferase [bacterium]